MNVTRTLKPLMTNGRYNYNALRDLADAHAKRCRAQADTLCREAGIGGFCGCSLHNALISQGSRQGWDLQVTDYAKLRRARWLMDTEAFRPRRLLDQLYRRRGFEAFNW